MGNKGSNRRPQRSHSTAAPRTPHQRTSTVDSDKIGISNIPAAPLSMKNTNGKDLDTILKEIKNNPDLRNVERLPRDTSKSEEFKKTIELVNKALKENEHDTENITQFKSVNESRIFNSNKSNSVNSKSKNVLRSKSNVEDLGKKRKKLMDHLNKLNQLENEKHIKMLEKKT